MRLSEDKLDKLILRTNILIGLLLKQQIEENKNTVTEQVAFLNSLGLDYKEIAGMYGKTPSYISSVLTQVKKKKRSGK